jgi:hypothetical protein
LTFSGSLWKVGATICGSCTTWTGAVTPPIALSLPSYFVSDADNSGIIATLGTVVRGTVVVLDGALPVLGIVALAIAGCIALSLIFSLFALGANAAVVHRARRARLAAERLGGKLAPGGTSGALDGAAGSCAPSTCCGARTSFDAPSTVASLQGATLSLLLVAAIGWPIVLYLFGLGTGLAVRRGVGAWWWWWVR